MRVPQWQALLLRAHCWVLRQLHTCVSIWYLFSDLLFFISAHLSPDVNYEELARCTDDFNGAQCKAVCVEAVSIAPLQQQVLMRER